MRSLSGYENLPDDELVRRALRGEARAFEAVVARYERPLYSYARRVMRDQDAASDVTQETFLAAWETLGRFQAGRNLLAWLFGIEVNMIRRALRASKRHESVTPEGGEGEGDLWERLAAPEGLEPERVVLAQAERDAVRRLLLDLPEKYAKVMSLRYIAGLQCDEVAEALNLPPRTVRVQLHRGRELVKQRLGLSSKGQGKARK